MGLSSCHAKNIDYINEIASQDSVERRNEDSKASEPKIIIFVSLVHKVKLKDVLKQSLGNKRSCFSCVGVRKKAGRMSLLVHILLQEKVVLKLLYKS